MPYKKAITTQLTRNDGFAKKIRLQTLYKDTNTVGIVKKCFR